MMAMKTPLRIEYPVLAPIAFQPGWPIYDSVDLIPFLPISGKVVVVSRCYHWTGKLAL